MHKILNRSCPLNKGFTLIELLVVVAIIGLLSSVVLASLNTARMKAEDARRIGDLRGLQLAIEFYIDKFGHYPNENSSPALVSTDWYNGNWGTPADYIESLLVGNQFISSWPNDPHEGDVTHYYYYVFYTASESWYCPADPTPGNGGAIIAAYDVNSVIDRNDPNQSSCEKICKLHETYGAGNWLGDSCIVWF
jgi:type IV pilus assembly protein PilA